MMRSPLRFTLRVSWDARARDLPRDATALVRLFQRLGQLDARLARWYPSEPTAANPAPVPVETPEPIVMMLWNGEREWEHDGHDYKACQATFTNGLDEGSECAAELVCGIDVPSTAVWFPNHFSLDFWGPGHPDTFADPSILPAALEAAATTFGARWGLVGPKRFPEPDIDGELAGRPTVSWLLYLSAAYGAPPPLPAPSFARACPDGGHLIVVTDDWLDPDDPEHVQANERVRTLLADAGLLRPSVADPP